MEITQCQAGLGRRDGELCLQVLGEEGHHARPSHQVDTAGQGQAHVDRVEGQMQRRFQQP